jgi:hypothetical protein
MAKSAQHQMAAQTRSAKRPTRRFPPASWAEPGKTNVMARRVRPRRRLMRSLRCCGLRDGTGGRGATSAVRVDTWKPFGLWIRGRRDDLCQYLGVSCLDAEGTPTSPESGQLAQVPLRYVSEPRRGYRLAVRERAPAGGARAHTRYAKSVGNGTLFVAEPRFVSSTLPNRIPHTATPARSAARWPTPGTWRARPVRRTAASEAC